jgi:predicted nucleic acid-binding protein
MLVTPGDNHWNIFENLCKESAAAGNLTQDAWFAALAIESSCEFITVDRDCARFKGLRWRTPF